MPIPWQQYAEAEFDYLIDFGNEIAGDHIVGTPSVTATGGIIITGIQVVPSLKTGADMSAVKFLLTGGISGTTATITCRAVTAGGLFPVAKPLLDVL